MPPAPAQDISPRKTAFAARGGDYPRLSEQDASAACEALTRAHGENFHVLTRLVPARLRPAFAAVYAFCRWADDLADEPIRAPGSERDPGSAASPETQRDAALDLLAWWRSGLVAVDAASGQEPADREGSIEPAGRADAPTDHPVFVALAALAREHRVPSTPFHDLIDAFERDQRQTRYETWDDLLSYCQGSADPVGRVVLMLGGHRPPDEDPRSVPLCRMSDAVCTGLQIVNHIQDARHDLLERDRVYLPSAETGFDAADLRGMVENPDDAASRTRYIRAVRALCERTRGLFDSAADLPARVAPEIAAPVWLFRVAGVSLIDEIERRGCTTLWTRPRVGRRRKATLLLRASLLARRGTRAPTIDL